jgi:hypothetical protein
MTVKLISSDVRSAPPLNAEESPKVAEAVSASTPLQTVLPELRLTEDYILDESTERSPLTVCAHRRIEKYLELLLKSSTRYLKQSNHMTLMQLCN